MSKAEQDVIRGMENERSTKLLGAHVDEQLYWQFKKEAAIRQEQMGEALENAVRLYMAVTEGGEV